MSMNPVQSVDNTISLAIGSPEVPSTPATVKSHHVANSETVPNRDIADQQQTHEGPETPKDEVQVQRDESGDGQIVIKYLDKSGQVILQIPTSQVLALARAIERALDAQASFPGGAKQPQLGERKSPDDR